VRNAAQRRVRNDSERSTSAGDAERRPYRPSRIIDSIADVLEVVG
jgi:hypothetical protein